MADDTTVNETGPGPGKDAAPAPMIVLLAFYLVILTALLLWGIYSKWPSCGVVCATQAATSATSAPTTTPTNTNTNSNANTNVNANTNANGNGNANANANGNSNTTSSGTTSSGTTSPPPTPPKIESVSPKTGLISCTPIQVTIKGTGFKPGASALFGGLAGKVGKDDPTGQSITVEPPPHAEGEVDVVVRNTDGTTSDISKGAFTYTCPPTSETDLFWLVVLAGALGGALHGLRSLYWYVGCRHLLKSWTLMYVLLPFTGATFAVIFYTVIRAGLLTVTTKNATLGMIAVAVLVGLFSQQAAVKLKDIANAFLAKPEPGPPRESKPQGSTPLGDGSGTKPDALKPAITPPSGPAGTPVKITGMKNVTSVTFGGVPGTNLSTAADGTITVTPPTPAATPTGPVDVIVTGDKGTVKLSFTYTS
jgi:IPT/TIG domain